MDEPYIPVPINQHKHYRTGHNLSSSSLSLFQDVTSHDPDYSSSSNGSIPAPFTINHTSASNSYDNINYAPPYNNTYLQGQLPPEHPLSQYSNELAAKTDGSASLFPSSQDLLLVFYNPCMNVVFVYNLPSTGMRTGEDISVEREEKFMLDCATTFCLHEV